ncbi:MAG TPA: quinolinate synthase NadA [Phycisphaerae bacterium]|nr:quinolinate synthase NadA [Phycisphaerae bacterium]
MRAQEDLPAKYTQMSDAELCERIAAAKAALGESLCILGHHYQRDEVIQFADLTGDSLKLSQLAAEQRDARYIVFCGVHFMAESADILTGPDQVVCLPNLQAGCTMADMADEPAVATALEEVGALAGAKIVPVTYVNSTAAIKALTGRAGGACCTSSNVRNVFVWALRPVSEGGAGAGKVFAVPDQHLGRNTAVAMGYTPDDCAVYDPALPNGGLTADAVRRATFILWKGHCYVHQVFTPQQVRDVRAGRPGIFVIVHPECPREVVQLADAAGSTEQIIRAVEQAKPGSSFAIGTESNLVNRLAKRHKDRFVRVLSGFSAICRQMGTIDLPHLLWVLDNLVEGKVVNQVSVPRETTADAKVALQRMIDIKAVPGVTKTK